MSTKSKIAIGIAAVLILAGSSFFIFSSSHLPNARKSLDDTGILISKSRLADVGYDTPEAALETHTWAMANTHYDKMVESVAPEIRASLEKAANGRQRFEAGIKRGMPSFEKLHILAKKIIADDKVELKVATEQKQKDSTFAIGTIEQMIKIANEWKWGNTRSYDPAWDEGSQPEPTSQR